MGLPVPDRPEPVRGPPAAAVGPALHGGGQGGAVGRGGVGLRPGVHITGTVRGEAILFFTKSPVEMFFP